MNTTGILIHLVYDGESLGAVSFPAVLPVGTRIEIGRKKLMIGHYRATVNPNTRRSGCDAVTNVEAVMECA